MADGHAIDMEKGDDKESPSIEDVEMRSGSVDEEIARARTIQSTFAPLRVLRQSEVWLDSKLGIETQGIDRIPEEDKRPPSIINTFLLWWSMTMHVGTLPIGFLGPEFGLSLNQSVAAIVVGTFLGALCSAYTGTLGPRVGQFNPFRYHADACLTARSPPDCLRAILLRLLGRKALLDPQCACWWRFRSRERGRLRADTQRRLGLQHDDQRRLCNRGRDIIRGIGVWTRHYSHI